MGTFEGGEDRRAAVAVERAELVHPRPVDEPRPRRVQRRVDGPRTLAMVASTPRTVASDGRGFSAGVNAGIWPRPSPGGFAAASAVQLAGGTARADADVHAAAARGTSGGGEALPYRDTIQRAFGRHDVSNVRAYIGGAAREAAGAIGAEAYATGSKVAFASAPDLGLVAHEVAHVVQQRGGVQLSGGVGHAGDPYEQHADAVADLVVRGGSAESLLDMMAPSGSSAGSRTSLQRREIQVTATAEAARTIRDAIGRATPEQAAQIATQLRAVTGDRGTVSFRVGADHYTVTVLGHDATELAGLADAAAHAPPAAGGATPAAPRITADLHRLGPGGAGGAVAPVEFISASGSGQETTDVLTTRIVHLMHADPSLRFVDAARRVVRGHLIHDEPTASARVGAQPDILADQPVRFALVIGQANYPGSDADLPEIAQHTAPGAAVRSSIERDYGRDHTRVVHDRTRDQIVAEIRAGIDRAAAELHDGQQGELMVNFQGHGLTRGLTGVDWGNFTPADMLEMSSYAVEHRVHLVIVDEACDGGTMTHVAQQVANAHLDARVDQAAAGRGGLSAATAAQLHTRLETLRSDLRVAIRLGVQLEDLDATSPATIDHAMAEIRHWLRELEPTATTGIPLLSGDVSAQLRDCWQQLVVDNVPVHGHAQAHAWVDRLDHLVSQIGAEVSAAHEEIALILDLSSL